MPYNTSALRGHAQAGDPFLGSIVKGVGRFAGGAIGGLLSGGTPIAAITGGIKGISGRHVARRVPRRPGGTLAFGAPGGFGAVQGVQQQLIARHPRSRRRMQYSNQKALRRALRRVTGYARQQKRIKKAAREFAREFGPKHHARRDVVVPRHTVVR